MKMFPGRSRFWVARFNTVLTRLKTKIILEGRKIQLVEKMKTLTPHPKKFTRETYHKMAELAIFQESDRLELIKGEIIEMSPVGLRHASCVKKLNYLLTKKLGDQVILSVQDPIQLTNNSEPQPDLVVLKYRPDFYANEHPHPEDILLLIEVSDSSIDYDKNVKIPLYAENQISEVWLVNLNDNCVEIYQKPYQNYYQSMQKLSSINNTILSNFPKIEIQICELF